MITQTTNKLFQQQTSNNLTSRPDKKRVRSKPELQAVLGPNADLTCFSYRKGEFMSTPQGRNFTPNTEEVAKVCVIVLLPRGVCL